MKNSFKKRAEAAIIADAILKNYDICEIGRSHFFIKINRWFELSNDISQAIFLGFLREVISEKKVMFSKQSLSDILETLWNAGPLKSTS